MNNIKAFLTLKTMKNKGIGKVTILDLTPRQYEKIIEGRDNQIEDLITLLKAMRIGRFSELIRQVEKLLHDRNQMEILLNEMSVKVEEVIRQNQEQKRILEHFKK